MDLKKKFIQEATILLERYENNDIYDFREVKAKIAIKSEKISNKLYENIRFCENTKEVKDLIENVLKEKITLKEKIVLKEEETDTDVESLDKVSLFADLTAAGASIQDALNSLYPYKFQLIEDPQLKKALSEIRIAISTALQKLDSTIGILGTENDKISSEEDF